MTTKDDKRNLVILFLAVLVIGTGMLIWGQYNTAIQVFDIGFNRNMVTMQLEADETWIKTGEEAVLYDSLLSRANSWRENTEKREGVYTARTASEIYGKTAPVELTYELYENGSATTVVLLHAYNESISHAAVYAPYWWSKGYNVLIPTLRGHYESGGATSLGAYEQYDLLDLIRQEGLNEEGKNLIIHGEGMGAATALLLAGNEQFSKEASIDFIVSDNTYSGLKELELKQLKQQFSLGNFMVGIFLDTIVKSDLGFKVEDINVAASAANINIPVVMISGDSDGFIGPEQTKTVYEALKNEKELLLIGGAGYNLSYAVSKNTDNKYESAIDNWLLKLGF